jgi:hypothetical protein
MTDVIVAFVLMLVVVSAAELVRMICRRQLLTPVRPRQTSTPAVPSGQLELSR